jgi:CDP-2,3-bis-(O-geranylgeranyl)-sn-glycerol synthase
MQSEVELLILVIAANGAPIVAENLLGRCWSWPLDGGLVLGDGRRLLGRSATVRGVFAAVALTAGLAFLLGHPAEVGALIGFAAMVGDALSSFAKRRVGLEPGERAPGLDQIPESLLPLLAVARSHGLDCWTVAVLVVAFVLFDMLISRVLFRLRLRQHPH